MTKCNIDPKNQKHEFTFLSSSNGSWILKISADGIKFNHKDYPNIAADEFAKAFCEILERNFKVKFEKREN